MILNTLFVCLRPVIWKSKNAKWIFFWRFSSLFILCFNVSESVTLVFWPMSCWWRDERHTGSAVSIVRSVTRQSSNSEEWRPTEESKTDDWWNCSPAQGHRAMLHITMVLISIAGSSYLYEDLSRDNEHFLILYNDSGRRYRKYIVEDAVSCGIFEWKNYQKKKYILVQWYAMEHFIIFHNL